MCFFFNKVNTAVELFNKANTVVDLLKKVNIAVDLFSNKENTAVDIF